MGLAASVEGTSGTFGSALRLLMGSFLPAAASFHTGQQENESPKSLLPYILRKHGQSMAYEV